MNDQLPFEPPDSDAECAADLPSTSQATRSDAADRVVSASRGSAAQKGADTPADGPAPPDWDTGGHDEGAGGPVDDPTSDAGEEEDETAETSGPAPSGGALRGVLTNRWNLIEFLSRRLIVPMEVFVKYYDDLLRLTPGRVPLVTSPVSDDLVAAVTGEDPAVMFPVFIEVDRDFDGESCRVIPWSKVIAVHFRNKREREEHIAREFDNVSVSPVLKVSPELFGGGTTSPQSLEGGDARAATRTAETLDNATRWSGAIVAALHALSGGADRSTALALARLLDGRAWGKAGCRHLQVLQAMRSGQPPTDGNGLEQRVVRTAALVFSEEGLPGDPVGFIRSLDSRLGLDEQSRRAFDRVAGILDGDIEFRPFKGSGSPVAKGLLVALLRREPARLLPWAVDSARSDPATLLTAGVLLGLAAGRHTLGGSVRPEALDSALAHAECDAVETGATPRRAAVKSSKPAPDGAVIHTVSLDGFPALPLVERPTPLSVLLSQADPLDPGVETACVELAVAQGWTSALTLRRDVLIEILGAGEPAGPEATALRKALGFGANVRPSSGEGGA
jgi:hypothetical protein